MNKEKRLMMSEEEVRQRAKELLNLPKEHLITQYIFLEQENKELKEELNKYKKNSRRNKPRNRVGKGFSRYL